MDAFKFDRISTLTTNKTDKTEWKLKARLTRIWKCTNATTGEFKGYNMILLDDDKMHIHAFAGMDFVNGMDDVPEEGKVYIISDFNVDDALHSYSAVSNKKEIYFLKRTSMKLAEEDDEMIPKYKFELAALNTLNDRVGDTKILTDLMGVIENILPMQSRNTPKGPKDILMFDISDGSSKVRVTVWADMASTLHEELEKRKDEEKIIIITSCGITLYRSQLQASTLSPSKFYINPDYDAVYALRYRLNAINAPMVVDDTSSVDDCPSKKMPIYTLNQITELRNSDLPTLEVMCHVSVCSLDEKSKWWFYSCDACPGELDDTYKCQECDKTVSYPDKRFKVSLYVTDPTETVQVFLFDREVRRLVSTTVNSLIGQNIKEGKRDQFPEKLMNIIGKNLALTVSLNAKNMIHGNTVYFASDVVEISEQCSPSENSKINVEVLDFALNGNPAGDTLVIKSATKKRPGTNEDGANKKNKTKIV